MNGPKVIRSPGNVTFAPWSRQVSREGDPEVRAGGGWARPVLIGLLGATLIAVAASLSGSPLAYKVPGAWFFGTPANDPSGAIIQSSGLLLLTELALAFGGMLLLTRAWVAITRETMKVQGIRPWRLARILGLWSVPLLIAPPMFSDDIYSYAAQGQMVSLHISPYLYGPGVMGATPLVSLARGIWINTPAPYGPLFTGLDGSIARVTGGHVFATLVLLRLLAVAGVALAAIFLPSLARSYGRDAGATFSLVLLNPLVLLFLIGSGHNDALMIGLLIAGLAVARRGHPAMGIVLCVLAGAVKAPGLIGVFAIAWTNTGAGPLKWRRPISLAKAALIAATTLEILSVLFGVGWGWLRTQGASSEVTNWLTPTDIATHVISGLTRVVGVHLSSNSLLGPVHVLGLVAVAAIGLWALWRLPDLGLMRAMAICLLALVLLGPIVEPWYLTWGIVLLAISGGPRTSTAIIQFSVLVAFLGIVGIGQLISDVGQLGPLRGILLALILTATAMATVELLPLRKSRQAALPQTARVAVSASSASSAS
jgi:alpha-1,6-mannosyltransferase